MTNITSFDLCIRCYVLNITYDLLINYFQNLIIITMITTLSKKVEEVVFL